VLAAKARMRKNHIGNIGSAARSSNATKATARNSPAIKAVERLPLPFLLRAMSRGDVRDDDLVTFMDGDFVIAPGNLKLCLPLFAADPELQALTTHEAVLVRNVWWMQSFLNMRFSQRHMVMQSHALSGRVLTLTGRMSVFRAKHVITNEFIRLLEADYLDNWLWGTFRFLSGDDKSTWYSSMAAKCSMCRMQPATRSRS